MALTDINPVADPVQKKGGMGGLIGSLIGGAAGLGAAVAAPFTGGTSLAALPAVLGGAAAAAPVAGNLADPAKIEGGGAPVQGPQQIQGPQAKMNVMADMPEVQLATVENARSLIPTAKLPQADAMDALGKLNAARDQLRQRLNIG